jgi:RNA polymerase sigma-70 factor (ECF subfamily)
MGGSGDDGELAVRVRAGDRGAEAALCRRWGPRIAGFGLAHLHDRSAADDLVQQVLVAVLAALRSGRVEDPDKLGSYILTTCRRMAWQVNRSDDRRSRDDGRTVSLDYEIDWSHLERERLLGCLEKLSARARTVVVETFCNEATTDEISARLGLSTGNVRVIRHRALAELLVCIEGGEA